MIFLAVAFLMLILVLLVNTLRFKPLKSHVKPIELLELEEESILNNLSKMIQVKTVSHLDESLMDHEAFDQFKRLLDELYPKVRQTCEIKYIGPRGILYKWKGHSDEKPVVLMSHYDVVPVEEAAWQVAPFSGSVIDGTLWGRGTLDTKTTLLSVMESAEKMIKEGYKPSNDIYFSFAGDEEISGPSAPLIVDYLRSINVKPHLVLDEGGVVIDDVFPGVRKSAALIGIGEKGYLDLEVTFTSKGGHASAPPNHSIMSQLNKWLVQVEKQPMKSSITPPIKAMFDRLGRHSTFAYRLIFSNLWLFSPLLKILFKRIGGQMNALIRTTIAPTMLSASTAFNVLPSTCKVGLNCRLLNTNTIESTQAHILSFLREDYEVKIVESREASKISRIDTEQFQILEEVISGMWPQAIVSPYLMTAATDSRHFCEISDHVMRFAPMYITGEELSLIHSHNERIRVETVIESVQFYCQLLKRL